MKKLYEEVLTLRGEDGAALTVRYDNRGEPYRQGASFWFVEEGRSAGVFLEEDEARRLRDLIDKIFPPKPARVVKAR